MMFLKAFVAVATIIAVASGCAATPPNASSSLAKNEARVPGSGVDVPQLSVPDDGTRLNTRSGPAMSLSVNAMLRPLKKNERLVVARAIVFLANLEGCRRNGIRSSIRIRRNDGSRLTPEQCFEQRFGIHADSSQTRHFILQHGRPDDNHREKYWSLATGEVDRGWTSTGSWNRFAAFAGPGLTGRTRTDILTEYKTLLGFRAEKILPEILFIADDVLANPLGALIAPLKQ